MEALVNAASEFFAAIFARFGYVGRPRHRINLRDEIKLLDELKASASFGSESDAVRHLQGHIEREINTYSGVGQKQKAWRSALFAFVVGIPLAYWTYKLNDDHFSWVSLIPGVIAGFLLLGALGIVFGEGDSPEEESE